MISLRVRVVKNLHEDRSGISLIFVTMLLPVIMGFALLAVDVGRVHSLHSSLQHGADALALAGAGELDFTPDSITRSNRAIDNIITTNTSIWSTSAFTINGAGVTRCYLAALPANDAIAIADSDCLLSDTPANLEASSLIARFVRIRVNPVGFTTLMPASFLGLSDTSTRTAEAVAGFQAAVCNFTPMFICNPYEPAGNTVVTKNAELLAHFSVAGGMARQINMKQTGGNGAQYFPGNFGFLIPAGTNANPGAATLREFVGKAAPEACFAADGVELRTGAITSIRFGFNTRFDIYDGPMNGESSSADYRPARNVIKGYRNDGNAGKGSACNPNVPNAAESDEGNSDDVRISKMRRDACFLTPDPNDCDLTPGLRIGDGDWDITTYFQQAHGTAVPGPLQGGNFSRYEVYRYEVDNNLLGDPNAGSTGDEIGAPRCSTATANDNPDRRIFNAAILNCLALDTSVAYGPIQGGSSNKLPVVAFGRFFITEPVNGGGNVNTSDGDIWAELVGIEKPGAANSVARDIVQLFR